LEIFCWLGGGVKTLKFFGQKKFFLSFLPATDEPFDEIYPSDLYSLLLALPATGLRWKSDL